MYGQSDGYVDSPLTHQDIQKIDARSISSQDKHYLRLLAHALFTLQSVANTLELPDCKQLPNKEKCLEWLILKRGFNKEDSFVAVFLEQLDTAAKQLEVLGKHYLVSPLELSLDQLIDFVEMVSPQART